MYDLRDRSPSEEFIMGKRWITIRVAEAPLRRLMRARRMSTPSEFLNTLLAEEEERLRSHAVLRETAVLGGRVGDRPR
jgi:hypothetical protein